MSALSRQPNLAWSRFRVGLPEICVLALVLALVLLVALGLVLGLTGGSRSSPLGRAETEIKGLESAVEAYQIDHGEYPSDAGTDQLEPNTTYDPAKYVDSSAFLYRALSGNFPLKNTGPDLTQSKPYFDFRPEMLRTSSRGHLYIVDPKGNSYGYSTFESKHPHSRAGNNPTFDLWSTGGGKSRADQAKWIKNW